jgi:putative transposase
MARLPRIVIPGLPHHVTQRGNRKQCTFFRDRDYLDYKEIMSQSCRRYDVTILAYCLMPNHVHLVCKPNHEDSLKFAIGSAHEKYSKQINFEQRWTGHLWQGRFFSVPVDDNYLAACVRYVELNPVRAGLCNDPWSYPWSSARAHIAGNDDELVTVRPMLELFPDWIDYLNIPISSESEAAIRTQSQTGRPLGSDPFIRKLEEMSGRTLIKQKPGPRKHEDGQ